MSEMGRSDRVRGRGLGFDTVGAHCWHMLDDHRWLVHRVLSSSSRLHNKRMRYVNVYER
jgi:hypothetical protein